MKLHAPSNGRCRSAVFIEIPDQPWLRSRSSSLLQLLAQRIAVEASTQTSLGSVTDHIQLWEKVPGHPAFIADLRKRAATEAHCGLFLRDLHPLAFQLSRAACTLNASSFASDHTSPWAWSLFEWLLCKGRRGYESAFPDELILLVRV